MESSNEKLLIDYPYPVFAEETETILKQMKKSVTRICCQDGSKGTGFFCRIPLTKTKYTYVLISNYHVIKEGSAIEIQSYNWKCAKKINLENNFKYSNPVHDVSIIEIKELAKDKEIEFMELDENVLQGNNLGFAGSSIYILHYPRNFKRR